MDLPRLFSHWGAGTLGFPQSYSHCECWSKLEFMGGMRSGSFCLQSCFYLVIFNSTLGQGLSNSDTLYHIHPRLCCCVPVSLWSVFSIISCRVLASEFSVSDSVNLSYFVKWSVFFHVTPSYNPQNPDLKSIISTIIFLYQWHLFVFLQCIFCYKRDIHICFTWYYTLAPHSFCPYNFLAKCPYTIPPRSERNI